jgi:hypothetical protein
MNVFNTKQYVIYDNDFINLMNNSLTIYQSYDECYNIYQLIKLTNNLDYPIVEIGVYNGGSSFLINKCRNKNKRLYLFDTFEGLLDVNINDNYVKNGQIKTENEKNIYDLFKDEENIKIIKGYFPDVIKDDIDFNNQKFSFVHLDVDTYQSTLNCLMYFYDKMIKNGIILTHDYSNTNALGVNKSFNEFFKDKSEHIIHLFDTQGMIIKI